MKPSLTIAQVQREVTRCDFRRFTMQKPLQYSEHLKFAEWKLLDVIDRKAPEVQKQFK